MLVKKDICPLSRYVHCPDKRVGYCVCKGKGVLDLNFVPVQSIILREEYMAVSWMGSPGKRFTVLLHPDTGEGVSLPAFIGPWEKKESTFIEEI